MSYIVERYGIEIDLSKEGHVGCPKCLSNGKDKSKNNFMVYGLDENGQHRGGFCWSCEYTIPSFERMVGNDEDLREVELVGSTFNEDVHNKIKARTRIDETGYRGIKASINKYFGVRTEYDDEGNVEKTYYPVTQQGKISGYKVRTHPKNFASPGPYGETGKDCDLFGQFRFETFGNTVVIVGGEHDQLAAYQMLSENQNNSNYDPPAVVSPTIGESGAYKQVQAQYHFFNRFKKIIVCMDNDDAGSDSMEKIVKVLPRGKVYVMRMRLKDPNAYLEAGKVRDFINDFWNAKIYTPAGVHASTSLYDAVLQYTDQKKLSLPNFMPKLNKMFGGGWVKGEISVIFAKTSIGKSSMVDALTVNWVENDPDETVGVLSLEATVDKYSANLFSNYLGTKIQKIKNPEERKAYLESDAVKEQIKQFTENLDGTPRFYVCDDRGADLEVVKEKILEMIIQMGVTVLIIDPFSDLLSGLDLSTQEEFTAWLKKILKEYPYLSLVLVCHVRKGKSGDGGSLTEDDVMGSSTIIKSSANTISLERNKLHENELMRNVTLVTVHKNRHDNETGPADEVYYDWRTGRLYDFEQWKVDNPQEVSF